MTIRSANQTQSGWNTSAARCGSTTPRCTLIRDSGNSCWRTTGNIKKRKSKRLALQSGTQSGTRANVLASLILWFAKRIRSISGNIRNSGAKPQNTARGMRTGNGREHLSETTACRLPNTRQWQPYKGVSALFVRPRPRAKNTDAWSLTIVTPALTCAPFFAGLATWRLAASGTRQTFSTKPQRICANTGAASG